MVMLYLSQVTESIQKDQATKKKGHSSSDKTEEKKPGDKKK